MTKVGEGHFPPRRRAAAPGKKMGTRTCNGAAGAGKKLDPVHAKGAAGAGKCIQAAGGSGGLPRPPAPDLEPPSPDRRRLEVRRGPISPKTVELGHGEPGGCAAGWTPVCTI